MKKFKADALTKKQNYKLLSGSVVPRPIAFVTSQDKDGHLNAAPFSFFNVVNSAPPMIMISTGRSAGKRKDTSLNIEETESFVVHITDEATVEQINHTAAPLARNQNELERTSLNCVDSELVAVPGIEQAKIRMECKLDRIIPLGDSQEGSDLIIGEVVMFHIDESVYFEDSKIDVDALSAVARLAGNDYASLGNKFTIERPMK
ncbi:MULTISPECIES: flavin reductase family protein [Staphylococcus]|uniref:Flavin reductase family protein n=1 Tax=Staphylococcus xylosus TaxID=1288 RepID=A0A418IS44_STAXY|nr:MULTISPECIES: flavin reductase family protein [Staphylococcus]MBF0812218.1 flavin reductase family protein [Staphylococcus saprophyticus]MDW8542842.1 flavin reductase family protein [Staphylococcus sp. KG4-1]MRF36139.1 flavin reductase family protein [Staphylococcus sp. KY49P]MDW8562255.1 flavin reductase family protein [Staphylococcus sp. KG4-3]NQD98144.1 flavin reductase family protein [Staphylococcus xylosus]